MKLDETCPLCGTVWGAHKVYMSQNDCAWAMDAGSQTYDGAESRYRAGMWTQAQWEAFSALSAHDLGYPLVFPIDSEVAALIVLACDRIAQIGRPVRPGSEFFNRYESALAQINTEPLEG